jgi:hypothetical protein
MLPCISFFLQYIIILEKKAQPSLALSSEMIGPLSLSNKLSLSGFSNTCGSMKFYFRLSSFMEVLCC